jgi:hypothetical protein
MSVRDVTWVLNNHAHWTLAQHLNRLAKTLLRNSPEEYNLIKIICSFKNGHVETYHVNRRLDHERRREIKKYLRKNESDLAFFYVQFMSFSRRENTKFSLSGLSPFDHLDLIGENTPGWLHELINRRFQREISWRHKLWSYLYNHRPFRHSLNRE